MNVEDILRTKGSRVVTVAPRETVARALAVLAEENIGALVVSVDGARVDGILSERDIVQGLARDGAKLLDRTVESLMTRNAYCSAPGDAVDQLMSQMTERRIRHLPVLVDGRLAGIVSIGDVVKSRLGEIENETEALREYIVHA